MPTMRQNYMKTRLDLAVYNVAVMSQKKKGGGGKEFQFSGCFITYNMCPMQRNF